LKSERVVEAALFSAGRPLKVSEIESATGIGSETIRKALKKLIKEYTAKDTAIEEFEHTYLDAIIEQFGGNIFRAARTIKLDRKHLRDKLNKYEISRPRVSQWCLSEACLINRMKKFTILNQRPMS